MNRLLIENLDYILTVDPLDRVVEAGAIVVEDDRLAAIGPSAAIAQQYAGARFDRVIDGCRTLAMPGLIDTHLHVTEQFARTLIPDNMPTRPTVFNWLMPFHAAATEEDEHVSMLCAGIEMLRTGTTCFLDMGAEENPEPVALGIERIGIRGITGRNAADTKPDEIPPFWTEETIRRHYFGSTEEALRVLERHVDRWHGYAGGRVRCWFNIQGKEPCSMALHVGVQRLATAHGVGTTYHAASTLAEAQGMEKHYGMWPITRLHHGGALGPNVVLAHAVAVREEEIRLLADAGTKVAFCPGTSLRGAKGATVHGKYPEMREGGVTVALGCDGAFAAGSLDMFRQTYLALGLFRDPRMDSARLSAAEALRMATIDGAKALLWDDEIGSLEVGKKADLLLLDLNQPEWVPLNNPVQAVVFAASPHSLRLVMVDGGVVMENRQVLTVDQAAVWEDARARAAAVAARAGLEPGRTPTTTALYD